MNRTIGQIAAILGIDCKEHQDVAISGVTIDSRKVKPGNLFVPFKGENADGHKYVEQAIAQGAAAALWQKDVPNPPAGVPLLFVEDNLKALQALAEAYLQSTNAKVVGITGSNGKTTTKDMAAAILSQKYKVHKTEGNYNNHLGLPLTILAMDEDTEVAVLEMGMSGKGEIELLSCLAKPDIAIITNIGESHLLDLGSREAIAEAKLEITTGLKEDGLLVYHGDEPLLAEKLSGSKWRTACFGRSHDLTAYPLEIQAANDHTSCRLNLFEGELVIPVLGNHNVLNAMAAILAAKELGVDYEMVKTGLAALKLSNMRMEMVEGAQGEKIINDAYNASPTAMRAAIDLVGALSGFGQKILVLGDMLELGAKEIQFHQMIGQSIDAGAVDKLFTFGELAAYIAEEAKAGLGDGNVYAYQDKQLLIEELKKHVRANDLVLVKASRGMKLEEVVTALQKKA